MSSYKYQRARYGSEKRHQEIKPLPVFQKSLIFLTLLVLAACQPDLPPTPSEGLPPCGRPVLIPEEIQNNCAKTTSRDLEVFQTLRPDMSFSEACAVVGKPDWVTGSGLAIFVYQLQDGSEVWLGFSGLQGELLYTKHILQNGSDTTLSEKNQ